MKKKRKYALNVSNYFITYIFPEREPSKCYQKYKIGFKNVMNELKLTLTDIKYLNFLMNQRIVNIRSVLYQYEHFIN